MHVFPMGQSTGLLQHSDPVKQAPPPSEEAQHVWSGVAQCGVVEPVIGGQHFAHPGAQVVWQVPSVVLMYSLQQKAAFPFLGLAPSGQQMHRPLWEQPEQHRAHTLLESFAFFFLFLVCGSSVRHVPPRLMQLLASTSAAGSATATRLPMVPMTPSTWRRSPMSPSRWEMASNRFGSTLDLSAYVTQRRPPWLPSAHTSPEIRRDTGS